MFLEQVCIFWLCPTNVVNIFMTNKHEDIGVIEV